MEGSTWVVDYYSQVLGEDNATTSQSLQQSALHQQYELIQRFEIKVTAQLTQEQASDTNHLEVRGTGVVYGAVIPNIGDMFLADVGGGRAGVFSVVSSSRKTMMSESYYEISYVQKHFLSDDLQNDFDRKTVRSMVFVKDYLHFGQNPKVLSEEYDALRNMDSLYLELLSHYFHDFFSQDHQTFVIPGQLGPAYDPFLTKALCSWISTDEHPEVVRVQQPDVLSDPAYRCMTVWDCISKMSADLLPTVIQKASLVPTTYFRGAGQYGGIYYSRLGYVVYPFDDRNDVDASYNFSEVTTTAASDLKPAGRRYKDLTRLIDTDTMQGFELTVAASDDLPDIVPVVVDDYYIFSEGFYRRDTPIQSKLEDMTQKALRRVKLDKPDLNKLAQHAMKWSNLERYYYIPILLALMKTSMRTN